MYKREPTIEFAFIIVKFDNVSLFLWLCATRERTSITLTGFYLLCGRRRRRRCRPSYHFRARQTHYTMSDRQRDPDPSHFLVGWLVGWASFLLLAVTMNVKGVKWMGLEKWSDLDSRPYQCGFKSWKTRYIYICWQHFVRQKQALISAHICLYFHREWDLIDVGLRQQHKNVVRVDQLTIDGGITAINQCHPW